MKRKFCGVALALGMLMQTVAAAVELSVAATLRDTDGRINGAQLTLQGLSDRVYALYAAFDKSDRGEVIQHWARREFVRNVTAADGQVAVNLDSDVLAEYPVVRYFLFESAYGVDDYPVEYLKNDKVASAHVAPFIDTGHTIKCGQTFELVWANATDFDGYNSENKGWGAGSALGVNITGGGRAAHISGNTYQIRPFIYGSERYFSPALIANDLAPAEKFRDVATVEAATTSYTMERLSDGTLHAISPVTTPNGESYDSGYTICLFSDSGQGSYKFCGRKLIYSAKLSATADGTAVFDLEPRVVAGVPGMYDKVAGSFLANAGGTSWTFTTGPVLIAGGTKPAATVLAAAEGTGVPSGEVTIVRDGAASRAVFAVKRTASDIYFAYSSDAALLTAPEVAWGAPVATGVSAGGVFELPLEGLVEGTTYYFACRFANAAYSSPVRRGSFAVASGRAVDAVALGAGAFRVVVGAGGSAGRLLAAYGRGDCGDAIGSWPKIVSVGSVAAAGGELVAEAPEGWMREYATVRFFVVDTPYDTAVDYLASAGYNQHQTVNLGIGLKVGSIFRFDWAMHQKLGRVSAETKGWGVGASLALNITGSRVLESNGVIQPYIYYGERAFSPSAKTDIAEPGCRFTDVCDIGSELTHYTMTSLRDGTLYAINPVATPANYDSQVSVQLFSDTPGSYTYWGVRRIYSAAISERTADGAETNDVARLVPVVVDGTGAFYDEVRGTLYYNADTGSTLAAGPAAATARVQCGASAALTETAPTVQLTPCPLGDGRAVFTLTVLDAGAGAESVDLQVGWSLYGEEETMRETVAGVKSGASPIIKAAGFENNTVYSVVCRAVNNLGVIAETRRTLWYDARPVACAPERPERGESTVELTFAASPSVGRLYACFGNRDAGAEIDGWDFVDSVNVPAGADSLAYTMPFGWGKDYTRMRFLLVNSTVYPVEYLESIPGTPVAATANYIDTGFALAYGRTLTVDWANARPGGYAEFGENKGWGCGDGGNGGTDETSMKYNFAGGGRIWPGNKPTPDSNDGLGYDHINAFMTWAAAANGALGHMALRDEGGVALAAADVVPLVYYRDTFVAGDNVYTLCMTNLTTGAGYTAAREIDLGGTDFVSPYNIFLFGDGGNCNYPGCKRIRSARMTEAGGRTLFNLVPFVKNGEAAFYDTVSKTWKTRYYANRADLQAGPAAVGGGMAQGVSPLVRAPNKGLNILVR